VAFRPWLYWTSIASFTRRLLANTSTTRRLDEQLVAEHGITIEEYELLLRLARAPGTRIPTGDLAEQPLLTAASVTRVLDRLERSGLVEPIRDADVAHDASAALTDAGLVTLRQATTGRLADLEELFGSLFRGDDETGSLGDLLSRLDEGGSQAPQRP
jgi:DNA-binding MarR family transcriptional regulator